MSGRMVAGVKHAHPIYIFCRRHRGRDMAGRTQRQRRRATAERTVAASQALVRTAPLYGVIFADPPWRFEPYSRITGMDRAADNHYVTMALDEIKALPVPAAPDCVLFLCATALMLPQALETMAAWGFSYRTHLVWVKDRVGTGYWARNKHELLLIGTRRGAGARAGRSIALGDLRLRHPPQQQARRVRRGHRAQVSQRAEAGDVRAGTSSWLGHVGQRGRLRDRGRVGPARPAGPIPLPSAPWPPGTRLSCSP
jgi:hypothetical protein